MPAVNADLAWVLDDVNARMPGLTLFKDYDEGNHRLLFATEKFRNTFGDLFREFADNLCDDVVNGITDRLQIIGWTAQDKSVAQTVDTLWERNKGEARTGSIHRNGFRDGDGFAIVQQDSKGLTRSYKQDPRMMAVRYDVDCPDEMDLVGKVWKVGKRYRVNLYYQDRLERWASKGSQSDGSIPSAGAFNILTPGDPLLKDDLEGTQKADGIPVFHFPNGEIGEYGRSILVPVIPLQDALNKAIADMLVAMEFHAYPQRWATGLQVERDPITLKEKDPFQAGEGRMWRGGKDAEFGQFDAATMEGFLAVQKDFRLEIARKGYMPASDISQSEGGQPPSGVALLVAEGRTVKLAKDRIRDWGPEHRRMMAYQASLELGTEVTPDELEAEWAPPETRDMKALLEEMTLKKELGVPTEQILKEIGYDQDEVDDFLDQAEEQAGAQAVALSVLQGGRQQVANGQAQTLNGSLGVPGGPVPPSGSGTPLAQG